MSKFDIKKALAGLFGCTQSAIKESWLREPETIPANLLTAKVTNIVIIAIARWKSANPIKRARLLLALLGSSGQRKQARLIWESVDKQYRKIGGATSEGIAYLKAEFKDEAGLLSKCNGDENKMSTSAKSQLTPYFKRLQMETPKRKHLGREMRPKNFQNLKNRNGKNLRTTRTILRIVKLPVKEKVIDTTARRREIRLRKLRDSEKKELEQKIKELSKAKVLMIRSCLNYIC